MSSKQQHWTDRHGFALSAVSTGLLAWLLMMIWQSADPSCVRDRDCDGGEECIRGECVPKKGKGGR